MAEEYKVNIRLTMDLVKPVSDDEDCYCGNVLDNVEKRTSVTMTLEEYRKLSKKLLRTIPEFVEE